MTNPASSNTGLTATIGLAAALAANPDTLTEADLKNPRIGDFFKAQTLTSGSSGWLAETYQPRILPRWMASSTMNPSCSL